jgi:hypothetical protein
LRDPAGFNGYEFSLSEHGAWSVLRDSASGKSTALATGKRATAPGLDTEIPISLTVSGKSITARVNGVKVWTGTDSTYANGMTGIGTGTGPVAGTGNGLGGGAFYPVQFTNFSVKPA